VAGGLGRKDRTCVLGGAGDAGVLALAEAVRDLHRAVLPATPSELRETASELPQPLCLTVSAQPWARRSSGGSRAAAIVATADSPQRDAGALHVVSSSCPAGDKLPVLLALDAALIAGSARGQRSIPAASFWPAYRQTALAPDELVLRIRLPLPARREVRFRKVGTRRAQAISKVVLALSYLDAGPSGPWSGVRVALGSVAPTPIRARATEAALEGRPPTPETADRAAETLAGELEPIDDVRSTAEYRRLVAARVLHRLIREAGGW